MANYDVEKLHAKLLDILLEFDRVAREHNLQYCICGGTMLGAVRHGGFIPWDDDLDISMPLPDYERLVAHSREWLPGYLEFICYENDKRYPLPFGKIQDARTTLIERRHLYYLGGCYIDVFPFGSFAKNPVSRWLKCARYDYLRKCMYFVHRDPYRHGRGPSSWIPLLTRRLYSLDYLQRHISRIIKSVPWGTTPYAGSYTDSFKKVMPREVTCTFEPVMFCGHEVSGIKNYDPYLKTMYGDYMQVPPPEKQIQHNFHYIDMDRPYREHPDYNPAEDPFRRK